MTNEIITNSFGNLEQNDNKTSYVSTLSRIARLTEKYNVYATKRLMRKEDVDENFKEKYPGGRTQLLDAVFAGCSLPYAQSSAERYTQEVEDDIKTIVELMPDTLTCISGELRCRDYVSPLVGACFNQEFPIHMIEFLLQKGADPNIIYVNGCEVNILEDVKKNISQDRFDAIKELFLRYGFREY